MGKVSTGIYPIDKLLDGGLETDIITSFYGPSASGKTNIALISSYNVARLNKKVIFIDTEGGFSFERLKQISKEEFDNVLKNILLYKPMNFLEQKKAILLTYEKVKENFNDIGLIVVDSISMLYRLEKGDENVNEVNIELAKQLQILSEIARKYNIPVLVTNQVYSLLEERDKIGIVGGDLIKYWSKCLVELKVYDNGVREAILRKHRYLPEGISVKFKIVNDGIIEYKEI
jgi:DNA repair protein RadB